MSHLFTKMGRLLSFRATDGIILGLIFGMAFALRVCLPYDSVFGGDWVRFAGNDPWYHMRLVENLVHHFPYRISFDPYGFYPSGQSVLGIAPLFDLLLGFPIWLIGLGSPSQGTIETVGAYFPAILGALVTIPVYFIGKELFHRNAGLLSAALVAILPGEFLTRSLLGFTDHHVAEVLFSTVTILFFILALKRAKEKESSFDHIRNKQWGNIKKPLIYALLTGIALGMYLLSWAGGLLLVFILLSYVVLQYIIDHLRGRSTDYLGIIGVPIFIVPLIMIVPFLNQLAYRDLYLTSLIIGMLIFPVLGGISRVMVSRNIGRAYYPLALVGLGLVGWGGLRLIDPSVLHSILGNLNLIFIPRTEETISEARPLFYAYGSFSLAPAWDRFTTSFVIAPIAFILIVYAAARKVSAGKILFLVWSVMMAAAMLGQVRYTYYLAVNVALLSGYFCWKIPGCISAILSWYGFKEKEAAPPKGAKLDDKWKKKKLRAKERRRQPKGFIARYLRPRNVSAALAIVVVFFLVFYPNIGKATNMASTPFGPNDDWHSALVWMRDNTPAPFQDSDFYYELYEAPPAGEGYDYPPSAYGVMSWWDYGYWITGIAHRIPNSNPGHATAGPALFFTAQDESSANEILDRLGSKYVIIDIQMASPYSITDGKITKQKFYAMAIFAGKSESQFYEIYYRRTDGGLEPVPVYYPEYYQSMCARLYNFDGKEVIPHNSTWVISYAEREGYKEILTTQLFSTYEGAKAYLESQTSPNYRIVGNDPFVSPVPLEKLEHYQPVYHSDTWGAKTADGEILSYYIEIFEYLP
jgi:oligosaccharyl transferase (archaeosortase A-associated)